MVLASLIYTNVDSQEKARTVLFSVLLGITIVGLLLLSTLRDVKPVADSEEKQSLVFPELNAGAINPSFSSSEGDRQSFESKVDAQPMISLSATLKQAFCSMPMTFLVPIIIYNGKPVLHCSFYKHYGS
jgi:hypothetical protein